MINKRSGFKPRAINHFTLTGNPNKNAARTSFTIHESFDPTFQFRPFKLYQILTDDEQFAITGEKDSDSVFLSKPDKNNKYQWLFIDSDTGAIAFFHDLKNYMSIDIKEGTVYVKRSDVLLKGLFNFKGDGTITLKDHPKYCLCFTKPGQNKAEESEKPAENGEEKKSESFLSIVYETFMESFNKETEPQLEVVQLDVISKNKDKYINTWKYTELMDLRDLTNNMDTIKELEGIGNANDKQITLLKRKMENEQAMSEIEINYRDDKIKGYEEHWFISKFLKPK